MRDSAHRERLFVVETLEGEEREGEENGEKEERDQMEERDTGRDG